MPAEARCQANRGINAVGFSKLTKYCDSFRFLKLFLCLFLLGGHNSLTELRLSVFEYIEGYYNTKRPHGTLNMLTPNEAEALYWEQTK